MVAPDSVQIALMAGFLIGALSVGLWMGLRK